MQNWVKLGKGEDLIKLLSETKLEGGSDKDFASMYKWINNDTAPFAVNFMKNDFTKKWKLKDF